MLKAEWNPASLDAARYRKALSRSFGGGWNRETYDWHFARPFAGRAPDVLLIHEEGDPVAGNAINYRQLRIPDGRLVEAGVITAAWTLPRYRGRGFFRQTLTETVRRAKEVRCPLLVAFVTVENQSGRGMRRRGADSINSLYCVSRGSPVDTRDLLGVERLSISADAVEGLSWSDSDSACFHYASEREIQQQFLNRPSAVEVLRVGRSCVAVLEHVGDTDRLQLLGGACEQRPLAVRTLAARSYARGRKFFMFTTAAWGKRCADESALEQRRGFMMFLPTGVETDAADMACHRWDVQSGDRM